MNRITRIEINEENNSLIVETSSSGLEQEHLLPFLYHSNIDDKTIIAALINHIQDINGVFNEFSIITTTTISNERSISTNTIITTMED